MTMTSKFDLIIIGSGSAATTVAFKAVESGKKVAVIDQKPIGGTCALRGCDPKKILVGVTDALETAKRLAGHGISSFSGQIKWSDLQEFKRSFTEPMSERIENGLKNANVDIFRGRARFIDSGRIKINDEVLEGDTFLIASGVRAASLNFPGSEYVLDNEGFLNLSELPEHVVFIGGGYISVEFASIVRKAGWRATILQRSTNLLSNFDRETADVLTSILKESGIDIITEARLVKIEENVKGYNVVIEKSGKPVNISADLVVHGAGREFDSDMGLELAGVEWTRKGVRVNEFLQSVSNPRVYSAGDSADTPVPKLTPVASMEGEIAAENILNGNSQKADYRAIPTSVFSTPPLAMVGITEDEARKNSINVKVKKGEMTSWYNSRRRAIPKSFYKVILDSNGEEILGAHILGENAEEVINVFALAMRYGLKASDLRSMPFTYPSDINDIKYML